MSDDVYAAFLRRQFEEGMQLARGPALLHLPPIGDPADRYLARFTRRGLVRHPSGRIEGIFHGFQ